MTNHVVGDIYNLLCEASRKMDEAKIPKEGRRVRFIKDGVLIDTPIPDLSEKADCNGKGTCDDWEAK